MMFSKPIFGQGLKAYAVRTGGLALAMVILFFVQSYFVMRLLKDDEKLNLQSLRDILYMVIVAKDYYWDGQKKCWLILNRLT